MKIEMSKDGSEMIIRVPMNGARKLSSSGKSMLIATGSEKGLGKDGDIAMTLSVYTKKGVA